MGDILKLKDMLITRRGSYGSFLEIRQTELEVTVWKNENSTENEDKLMSIVQEICDLKGVDFKEYVENYIKD